MHQSVDMRPKSPKCGHVTKESQGSAQPCRGGTTSKGMGHEDMCHKVWKRGRRRRNLNQVDQYSNAALSRALDLEGTAADRTHCLAHEIHVDLGVGILLELQEHLI